MDDDSQIQNLPCWSGPVTVEPLTGGITNRNFKVCDGEKKYVVRLGGDIPVHHVMRFNEHAASRAAADAGISPKVVYSAPGVLVIDFIEGKTADAAAVREHMDEIVDLVHRAHEEVTEHLRGPALSFWVFHVIRDYVAALREAGNSSPDLQDFLNRADELEQAVGEVELVFAHNDLLAANFLNDGERWWLIDWDYAGFNSPLFDLGGLASNNEFSEPEEKHMLERYFGRAADPGLWKQYQAMKTASLLRETLWSMVSEIHSKLDFDYKTYTRTNKQRFEQAWNGFKQS
jgi:thiamine kinase-like enzyme